MSNLVELQPLNELDRIKSGSFCLIQNCFDPFRIILRHSEEQERELRHLIKDQASSEYRVFALAEIKEDKRFSFLFMHRDHTEQIGRIIIRAVPAVGVSHSLQLLLFKVGEYLAGIMTHHEDVSSSIDRHHSFLMIIREMIEKRIAERTTIKATCIAS
jgi:hypothetical protein